MLWLPGRSEPVEYREWTRSFNFAVASDNQDGLLLVLGHDGEVVSGEWVAHVRGVGVDVLARVPGGQWVLYRGDGSRPRFVDPPVEVTSVPVPEPLMFFGPEDEQLVVDRVRALVPVLAGTQVVGVHVTAEGRAVLPDGREVGAEGFAEVVFGDRRFVPAFRVALLGCGAGRRSGSGEASFAERLAVALGVELWATDAGGVWQTADGGVHATETVVTRDGRALPRFVGGVGTGRWFLLGSQGQELVRSGPELRAAAALSFQQRYADGAHPAPVFRWAGARSEPREAAGEPLAHGEGPVVTPMGLVPHPMDYPAGKDQGKGGAWRDPLPEVLHRWESIEKLRSLRDERSEKFFTETISPHIDKELSHARDPEELGGFIYLANNADLVRAIVARTTEIARLTARRDGLVERDGRAWRSAHIDEQIEQFTRERDVLREELSKRELVNRPHQWMVPSAKDAEVVHWLLNRDRGVEWLGERLRGASAEQRAVFDALASRPMNWRDLDVSQVAALVLAERKGRMYAQRDEKRLLDRLRDAAGNMAWAKRYAGGLKTDQDAKELLASVRAHMEHGMLLATNIDFSKRIAGDQGPRMHRTLLDALMADSSSRIKNAWETADSAPEYYSKRGGVEENLGYAPELRRDRYADGDGKFLDVTSLDNVFNPTRDGSRRLPKYGELSSSYRSLEVVPQYGSSVIYWDPGVANRSTFTPGDSIYPDAAGARGVTGAGHRLGLLADADPRLVRLIFAEATGFRHDEEFGNQIRAKGYVEDRSYLEVQFHGDMTLNDARVIVINYRAEDGKRFARVPALEEAEKIQEKLRKHALKHGYGYKVLLHRDGDAPLGPELLKLINDQRTHR
ncbi:hypothetical protein A8924_5846 [Saccharopolyspora erythraea NRRL 2338]|nr:hypothetical protein A8924_5846 [Saccharopolyspora erythraea NRRL 2338]